MVLIIHRVDAKNLFSATAEPEKKVINLTFFFTKRWFYHS